MIDPIELLANAVATVSIVLAARNSVHTWWTGIVGCALFIVTFYRAALYADVTLQAFFIVTSVVGWWQWLRGSAGQALPVTHTTARELIGALLLAVGVTAGYGALLARFTDAYAPFLDSAILALSVVAQVFLLRRRVENWPVWLLVNTLAVPLYASRGLQLTAVLYAAYWVNAWFGWRRWRRLQRAGATA
jgi:nicotinamide mononucleotide transporter